jgi:lysophospholipase L1-like esterase
MKLGRLGLYLLSFAGLASAQIKVACIGNSITEGFGLQNPSTQSYPARLQALLGNGYKVQNDGASGRTMLKSDAKNSYWKFGKLGQALAMKPDIVTIELGTNDANNFASTWNSISAEFKQDYLAMIDTFNVLAIKPRFFVIQPLPIRGGNDATLVKANAIINEVAVERGATLVDCYTPFKGQDRLYADGLHPNAAGADTMAHILFRAISARPTALPDSRTFPANRSLFAGYGAGSFPTIAEALSAPGHTKVRVFDLRGTLLFSAETGESSLDLAELRSRLEAHAGLSWVSMQAR